MSSEASRTDCNQRVSNGSHRGKNFSVADDEQICLSWIHASQTSDELVSNNSYIWSILYEHAVSKNQLLEIRTVLSLQKRFLLIQREVRKFSYIYNLVETDEIQSSIEKALKTYKRNYKSDFKFLHCWEILKAYPKFQQSTATTSNILQTTCKSPATAEAPKSLTTSVRSRGLNILPDELQALLKACRDVGVEEARSRDERIEPLMYDVQQQMANYGKFPERKLYMIKKQYLRTEKKYRNGDMLPYPPEARILWGKIECRMDDESNDASWNKQIQYIVDYRKGLSFLSDLEIQELITEALKKDVESIPQDKRKYAFHEILLSMQTKHLCRRKNSEQLLQDYGRLKKQFMTGICKYFPSEATMLWSSGEIGKRILAINSISESANTVMSGRISSVGWTSKIEVLDLCRICQTAILNQTKDLFLDVFCSETYAAIIKRLLNIEITNNDGIRSTVICNNCSTFIESLVNFVQQCHESCMTNVSYFEASTCEKREITNLEEPLTSKDVLPNEPTNLTPADTVNYYAEYLMEDDYTQDEAAGTMKDNTNPLEDIPVEDTSEAILDEEARMKLNYRKYVDSRKSGRERKRQCHLCGKKVVSLVNHLESHSGKEFKCHVCGWVCPNRRQLHVHMNRHTKKNAFPCRFCDRVFYVWSSRKDHEITHTKAVFKCDLCDAEYKYKSYLSAHKKAKHLGIRNLKCTQCNFSTSIKSRLLNHVRSMHTSERPYQCSVCDFTANSSSGYYLHYQKHKKSGEVVDYSIKCAYCKVLFIKDAAMEAHIVESHPEFAVKI